MFQSFDAGAVHACWARMMSSPSTARCTSASITSLPSCSPHCVELHMARVINVRACDNQCLAQHGQPLVVHPGLDNCVAQRALLAAKANRQQPHSVRQHRRGRQCGHVRKVAWRLRIHR